MNVRTSVLALALGLALSGAASAVSVSSMEAEDLIARSGYTDISRLELSGDSWVGMARRDVALARPPHGIDG